MRTAVEQHCWRVQRVVNSPAASVEEMMRGAVLVKRWGLGPSALTPLLQPAATKSRAAQAFHDRWAAAR